MILWLDHTYHLLTDPDIFTIYGILLFWATNVATQSVLFIYLCVYHTMIVSVFAPTGLPLLSITEVFLYVCYIFSFVLLLFESGTVGMNVWTVGSHSAVTLSVAWDANALNSLWHLPILRQWCKVRTASAWPLSLQQMEHKSMISN
jgi:hypothetical protein